MKKVIILAIGMFALGFDAYVIAGLIPDISHTFQRGPAQVGQGVSVFTLFYALSAPFFASLLAGKPIKKVLLISIIIFGVANGLTALAPNFTIFILSRAIAGVGAGLFSPLAVAGSTLFVLPEQKGRALSLTIGGMSMGTVLGVPIGLYIANVLNWQAAMWVVVGISIIAACCIWILLPQVPISPPPAWKERLAMFIDKRVTITVSITLFASMASLGLYTYLAPLLGEIADVQDITLYLWAWGLGGLVGSLSIGYFIDYYKKSKPLMLLILFTLTLAIISIPIVINLPFITYVPFFIWGVMGWASQAPQQHILIGYQPKQSSAAVALNSSINYLGSAIGATLGGVIIATGAKTITLIYFAFAMMLISIMLQLLSMKKDFIGLKKKNT
ncbi:MFS transporter [Pontibacillus litoralis]|uniref:MFS transporter n=1 Tax=Pontibacillus litoralis JSM 072002 TaxID=1385512 RepID=A0A0A5G4S0_9BACI|nr:MFS transporter [Pontibacillus litoralis]KGX87024.1 MFS transporter [Pontibacillus litoralis JSM 072002]